MLKLIFLVTTFLISQIACEKFRFDNYTLYKVLPNAQDHLDFLRNLQYSDAKYDFWSEPVPYSRYVSVLSKPEHKGEFESILRSNGINYEIESSNIQQLIDQQRVSSYSRSNSPNMQWDTYYTLDGIYSWLDDLAAAYPSIVSIVIGGRSYEGREIKGIKISHGPGRKAVFLEGGIHAREWIAPVTVNYIANELLTSDDEEIMAAARDYDWYVFPVCNPDGYVWSHDEFRLWRKNRRPHGSEFGVDLNRNWNHAWLVAGASSDPSTEIFAGLGPFSEPETRSLSAFLRTIGQDIDLYLSFHSFGEMLLLPFGSTPEPLANYHEAINIGRRAMGALSVRYGTMYVTGNIAEVIYNATGGSIDWVKDQLNVPLVFCYELRGTGVGGFLLPTDLIMPSNLETMDSVIEMIHQAKRFGLMNSGISMKSSVMMVALAMVAFLF